jgi:hypothetical protein
LDHITDQIVALAGAAVAWFTGESGRVLIASGLGGLVRWIADEKRRIKTGLAAIVGGAIVGYYCWPALLHAPILWGGEAMDRTPEAIAMAGFLAGTTGVSGVKIFLAVLEARAAALKGPTDDAAK